MVYNITPTHPVSQTCLHADGTLHDGDLQYPVHTPCKQNWSSHWQDFTRRWFTTGHTIHTPCKSNLSSHRQDFTRRWFHRSITVQPHPSTDRTPRQLTNSLNFHFILLPLLCYCTDTTTSWRIELRVSLGFSINLRLGDLKNVPEYRSIFVRRECGSIAICWSALELPDRSVCLWRPISTGYT